MSQPVASARAAGGISGGGTGAGTGERNPWLVLVVLCTAVFMLLLDTTIVNVAQREIQESLDADLTQIQWVLDSYILSFAVLLLSFGRLGDVFGRKKLFMLGITIFTLASALCGASVWIGDLLGVSSISVLIGARVIQGIGGAFMMPQSLSLLTVAFPAEKRGAAMGIWGAVVALGAVTGPIIGGLIVTEFAWEWVFLINLPVGAVALWATREIVPESVDPLATKQIDWGGLVLSGVGIFALVYASIEGNKEGWTSPLILGLYALSVVLLAAFVWWENRVADPMMKLELFKTSELLDRRRHLPDRVVRDARHLLPNDPLPPGRPRLFSDQGRPNHDADVPDDHGCRADRWAVDRQDRRTLDHGDGPHARDRWHRLHRRPG